MNLCMNHQVSFLALGQLLSAYLTATVINFKDASYAQKLLCTLYKQYNYNI